MWENKYQKTRKKSVMGQLSHGAVSCEAIFVRNMLIRSKNREEDMKKTIASALVTALAVGAASTTFAAANPFSDVPSDHWAYDAVTTLAHDGVIEGYGEIKLLPNIYINQ